jgi:transcriptional regulator with XRE-family HTH domain
MKLREFLLKYREENQLSIREFAKKCGLSHNTIHLLEKGTNPRSGNEIVPDTVTYKKLADGMGMTMEELFQALDQNELVSLGTSMTDNDRLEALHQNPKLSLLFDRSRKMSDKDIDFMLQMADRIMGENYGER